MLGKTNLGGGGREPFALIRVTYPEGSVCTCMKGSKILTALDMGGLYVFPIPEAGIWTVSCTDGPDTESQPVNITAQYQVENVKLAYGFKLYYQGNQYSEVTGGWTQSGYSYHGYSNPAGLTFGTESFTLTRTANIPTAGTNNQINFTGYSTLYVKVKNCSADHTITLATSKTINSSSILLEGVITSAGLHEINVSSINRSCYLSVELNSANGFTEISEIYLT